jgi:hypothetical protein
VKASPARPSVAPMPYVRLLEAMIGGFPVVATDGTVGRLDELYVSVHADHRLRARVCTDGRVQHYDADHLRLWESHP